jgi:multicomponent Na+:H+ antiporter subunit B
VLIEPVIDILLLAFMIVIALAVVRMRDLFGVAMLFSLFSLLSAGVFTVMDAADVAFTEAAVGAGISTILMLATLTRTARREKPHAKGLPILPLTVVFITGALLVFGTSDLPRLGDPDAPIHKHVADRYLQRSGEEIGIPNVVTSVLASYRGYDTLGETAVIFTAGIAVIALLGLRRRRPRRERKTGGDDVLGETTVMPAAGIPDEPAPGRHQKGGKG